MAFQLTNGKGVGSRDKGLGFRGWGFGDESFGFRAWGYGRGRMFKRL